MTITGGEVKRLTGASASSAEVPGMHKGKNKKQFTQYKKSGEKKMLKTVYAIMILFMMVTLAGMLSGCTAMETLAEGISEKAISGSGLFG